MKAWLRLQPIPPLDNKYTAAAYQAFNKNSLDWNAGSLPFSITPVK